METRKETKFRVNESGKQKALPKYEPPRIITYTEEQILEQIGPAQTCSPNVNTGTGAF